MLYFKELVKCGLGKKKCNPYVMLCDVALFWKILFRIKLVDNYCKSFIWGRDSFCQMSFHDICWDWILHPSLIFYVFLSFKTMEYGLYFLKLGKDGIGRIWEEFRICGEMWFFSPRSLSKSTCKSVIYFTYTDAYSFICQRVKKIRT